MNFLKRAWESKSNGCLRPGVGVTSLREFIQAGVKSRLKFLLWFGGSVVEPKRN